MAVTLFAVDPGTVESGWVILDDVNEVAASGVCSNHQLLATVRAWAGDMAVEMVEARGMPLGRETIETILWTGRFMQASAKPGLVRLVYRRDVKLHLCGDSRAKDPNVRQALIDLYPPTGGGKTPQVGTKSQPGPLFGVKSHAWAALGVAATVREMRSR